MPNHLTDRGELLTLGLDSAFGPVSAALLRGETELSVYRDQTGARATEAIAPAVLGLMAKTGIGFGALDRIAVTVGPGGFTGLRASLAFAKGVALATKRPLMGFTTLEALAAGAWERLEDAERELPIVAAIDAKRDEVFVQIFVAGAALMAPAFWPVGAIAALWPSALRHAVLCGSGAMLVATALAASGVELSMSPIAQPDAAVLARLAQRFTPETRPAVAVYLRPADARPAG